MHCTCMVCTDSDTVQPRHGGHEGLQHYCHEGLQCHSYARYHPHSVQGLQFTEPLYCMRPAVPGTSWSEHEERVACIVQSCLYV